MIIKAKNGKRQRMRRYFNDRKEKSALFYTDLAIERGRAKTDIAGVHYTSKESDGGIWECIRIFSEEGAKCIGRPIGHYDTLNTGRLDLLGEDEIDCATEEIAKKLCEVVDKLNVAPERILVVGLGNARLTPDSTGPKTAAIVKPTLHIKEFDEKAFVSFDCSEIAVLTPGVTADSGIESTEIVRGVSRRVMPDVIIAIDSIATHSTERLGSTVQISDTGLFPGGGIGNHRTSMTEDTLGIPVIAIGVPTVIDSRVFAKTSDREDKAENEAMMVSPREIDEITDVAARIIGGAVNQAFGISPY